MSEEGKDIGIYLQGASSSSHYVLAHAYRVNEICAVCRHRTVNVDVAEDGGRGEQDRSVGLIIVLNKQNRREKLIAKMS